MQLDIPAVQWSQASCIIQPLAVRNSDTHICQHTLLRHTEIPCKAPKGIICFSHYGLALPGVLTADQTPLPQHSGTYWKGWSSQGFLKSLILRSLGVIICQGSAGFKPFLTQSCRVLQIDGKEALSFSSGVSLMDGKINAPQKREKGEGREREEGGGRRKEIKGNKWRGREGGVEQRQSLDHLPGLMFLSIAWRVLKPSASNFLGSAIQPGKISPKLLLGVKLSHGKYIYNMNERFSSDPELQNIQLVAIPFLPPPIPLIVCQFTHALWKNNAALSCDMLCDGYPHLFHDYGCVHESLCTFKLPQEKRT